LLKLHA